MVENPQWWFTPIQLLVDDVEPLTAVLILLLLLLLLSPDVRRRSVPLFFFSFCTSLGFSFEEVGVSLCVCI